jgi:hypothetical protein
MEIDGLKISNKGRIIHKGYEVDSIFYSLIKIPWKVLISLHFKGKEEDEMIKDYISDKSGAERIRHLVVCRMVWGASKTIGIAQKDLVHVSNTEKQGGRCHIHALVTTRRKDHVDSITLSEALKATAPLDILTFSSDPSKDRAFKPLDECTDAVAYYCKRNKNDMEARSEYIPPNTKSFLKHHADAPVRFESNELKIWDSAPLSL